MSLKIKVTTCLSFHFLFNLELRDRQSKSNMLYQEQEYTLNCNLLSNFATIWTRFFNLINVIKINLDCALSIQSWNAPGYGYTRDVLLSKSQQIRKSLITVVFTFFNNNKKTCVVKQHIYCFMRKCAFLKEF